MEVTETRADRLKRGVRVWILVGFAAGLLVSAGCGATVPAGAKPEAQTPVEPRPVSIAPEAREVIDRMAKFFGTRKGFTLRTGRV